MEREYIEIDLHKQFFQAGAVSMTSADGTSEFRPLLERHTQRRTQYQREDRGRQ
jgi:hypothetical protein